MADLLFLVLKWGLTLLFIGYGLYLLFSPYSHKLRRSLMHTTGNKTIKDFGLIDKSRLFGFWQTIRLLRVEKDGEQYFWIESRNRRYVSLEPVAYWLKLSDESAEKLYRILRR